MSLSYFCNPNFPNCVPAAHLGILISEGEVCDVLRAGAKIPDMESGVLLTPDSSFPLLVAPTRTQDAADDTVAQVFRVSVAQDLFVAGDLVRFLAFDHGLPYTQWDAEELGGRVWEYIEDADGDAMSIIDLRRLLQPIGLYLESAEKMSWAQFRELVPDFQEESLSTSGDRASVGSSARPRNPCRAHPVDHMPR